MMPLSLRRTLAAALLLAGFSASFQPGAQAQARWMQEARIMLPVTEGEVTGTLLDTLSGRADAPAGLSKSALRASRAPAEALKSLVSLRESLSAEGLALFSANRVVARFRFEIGPAGYSERLLSLRYIYRPPSGQDVPIVHLDTQRPAVRQFLARAGRVLPSNLAVTIPFAEELTFERLRSGAAAGATSGTASSSAGGGGVQLVSLGAEVIRDEEAGEQALALLLKTIRGHAR